MQFFISVFGSYRTFRHKLHVDVVYISGFLLVMASDFCGAMFRHCHDILWYDFSETYEPPLSVQSVFVRRKVWVASYRFTQNGGLKFWNSYFSQRVILKYQFEIAQGILLKWAWLWLESDSQQYRRHVLFARDSSRKWELLVRPGWCKSASRRLWCYYLHSWGRNSIRGHSCHNQARPLWS